MKKNLKTLVERTKFERPQCLVDMNEINLIEASGMIADLRHKKSAHLSALWRLDQKERVLIPMGGSDLEGFSQLTLWIFCEKAVGSTIRILFDTTKEGNGESGYSADVKLFQKGWNRVVLTLLQLPSIGDARSWKYISNICLTRLKGRRFPGAALYLDSFYLWENSAPASYELLPDLRRAVVFSKTGSYALVRGKRIANAPFGDEASPKADPQNGEFWIPLSPVVAGFVRSAEADSKKKSLTFTYRKHSYLIEAGTPALRVDGKVTSLRFTPAEQNGGLYVPASFAAELFGRKFLLQKGGLLVLSNRKSWFLKSGDALYGELLVATTFSKIDSESLVKTIRNEFRSASKPRLLFSKETVLRLRKSFKEDVKLQQEVANLEAASGSPTKKLLSLSLAYLASGKKKLSGTIRSQFDVLSLNLDSDLAKFGRTAYAMAVAYDSVKNALSEAEKAELERKLVRTCLRPALSYYEGKCATVRLDSPQAAAFAGGMTSAALAMADVYPETAQKLLEQAVEQMRACFLAAKSNQKGRLDLLLGARALEVSLGNTCGCGELPGVKEELDALFLGENKDPANVFCGLCERLFTK